MEQLAQFVTKSFEFNNCFSAKLLEAKQRTSSAGKVDVASAGMDESTVGVGGASAAAFLSFGLSALSSASSSSNASNASSTGSGNNSLMMDVDDQEEDHQLMGDEDNKVVMEECDEKVAYDSGSLLSEKCGINEEAAAGDEEEDEIDIETDSMSDLEDNKRLIVKAQERVQERLRVIKPTDLRIQGLMTTTRMDKAPSHNHRKESSSCGASDRAKDVNNNITVIKPPITKNWLIPEVPSEFK